MPDDDATENKGGTGSDNKPENNGNTHSNTNSGQDEWKAKYEEAQKRFENVEQERNLLRKKTGDLQKTLDEAITEKETAVSELSTFKETQAQAEKRRAAETKQNELLSGVSDETKALVKELGLELPDADDEDAVKAFQAKIDKLDARSSSDGGSGDSGTDDKPPKKPQKITGNNNRGDGTPAKPKTEEESLAEAEAKIADVKF